MKGKVRVIEGRRERGTVGARERARGRKGRRGRKETGVYLTINGDIHLRQWLKWLFQLLWYLGECQECAHTHTCLCR